MHFLWNDTKKRGTTFPRYDLVSKTPEPQVILDCQNTKEQTSFFDEDIVSSI